MKYTKHNKAKMRANYSLTVFEDVRAYMCSKGQVFGIDYDFFDGKIYPFSASGYVAAVNSEFKVDKLVRLVNEQK